MITKFSNFYITDEPDFHIKNSADLSKEQINQIYENRKYNILFFGQLKETNAV